MTKAKVTSPVRDYKAEFDKQRPLSKKVIYKLKPGTWVELRWVDSPNSVCLLVHKVEQSKGDCTLYTQEVVNGHLMPCNTHAVHDQIVAVHGQLEVVAPKPNRV